MLDAPGNS